MGGPPARRSTSLVWCISSSSSSVTIVPPQVLCTDNDPEFSGDTFTQWFKASGMAIRYIGAASNQNVYIERFNRIFRDGVPKPAFVYPRRRWPRGGALVDARLQRRMPHDSFDDLTSRNTANDMLEALLEKCLLDGEAYAPTRNCTSSRCAISRGLTPDASISAACWTFPNTTICLLP